MGLRWLLQTNTPKKEKKKKKENSPLYHVIFYQIEDKIYLQRSKKERKVKGNKASNKQAVNLAQANHMKDCGLIWKQYQFPWLKEKVEAKRSIERVNRT